MNKPWYSLSDAALLIWLQNFSQRLTSGPAGFHITTEQATLMAGKVTSFESALSAWSNPITRTPIASENKQVARTEAVEVARNLVAAINTNPLTTDAQRDELGIKLRNPPTPVPVPSETPELDVISVNGRTVNMRVHSATEHGRKPDGVAGANVWTFVGDVPPDELTGFFFWGLSTRNLFEVTFPNTVEPGSKVWFAAGWVNSKGQVGPVCDPVSTHVQFGGLSMSSTQAMKKVA